MYVCCCAASVGVGYRFTAEAGLSRCCIFGSDIEVVAIEVIRLGMSAGLEIDAEVMYPGGGPGGGFFSACGG
jgi:hypothetical protein